MVLEMADARPGSGKATTVRQDRKVIGKSRGSGKAPDVSKRQLYKSGSQWTLDVQAQAHPRNILRSRNGLRQKTINNLAGRRLTRMEALVFASSIVCA